MRLKQFQLDMSLVECILLSKNTKWKKTKHRNLGAKIIQHAKKFELSIAKNDFTAGWNFVNLQDRKNCLISNILNKYNLKEVQESISKLNLQHVNQLLDNEQERIVTWR